MIVTLTTPLLLGGSPERIADLAGTDLELGVKKFTNASHELYLNATHLSSITIRQ
jgi:hypothetical protein